MISKIGQKLSKAPAYRFAVFAEILLCYIFNYGGIQMIATLGPEIMSHYGAAQKQLGVLAGAGTCSMAVMSLCAGVLAARFGCKLVILLGLGILAASGAIYAAPPASMAMLIAARAVQGLGIGTIGAVVVTSVACWFPSRERATAVGLLVAFYGACTSAVTAYAAAASKFGLAWHQTSGYMLMAGGAVLAALIAAAYRNVESVYGVPSIDDAIEAACPAPEQPGEAGRGRELGSLPDSTGEMLRSPAFWCLCAAQAFYGASSGYGLGFVFPLYLAHIGCGPADVSSIMTYGSLGTLVFCFSGGIICDRVFRARRTPVVLAGFGLAAVATALMMLFARGGGISAAALSALLFVIIGAANFGLGPQWVLPVEIVGPRVAKQNMGINILCSGTGGTQMLTVYGWLAETFGAGASMAAFAVCLAAACLLFTVLNRRCGV